MSRNTVRSYVIQIGVFVAVLGILTWLIVR